MKLKFSILKHAGIVLCICMLLLSSLFIFQPKTAQAASNSFYRNSITSKEWSVIKPHIDRWINQQIPYSSPCSHLIDWKNQTAYGLDCSGFVNTMVHLYYEDGTMRYNWMNWFASTQWAEGLEAAGLKVLQGSTQDEFNNAYKKRVIQAGDIIVYSNDWCRGVHVGLVYGHNKKGEVLIAHEYGDHLQVTTSNDVISWEMGSGNWTYYEVFAGTPRMLPSNSKTANQYYIVDYSKLKRTNQYLNLNKYNAKYTKVTYRTAPIVASSSSKLQFSKLGFVKVGRGLRRGTYRVNVTKTIHNKVTNKIALQKQTINIKVK